MPDAFQQGLDALIRYVEQLREQGVRTLAVAPATLTALSRPAPRTARPPNRPAKHPTPATPRPGVATPAPCRNTLADSPSRADGSNPLPPGDTGPSAKLSPAAKEKAMKDLRERALACRKCAHLAASRTQVVFGVGDIHSPLMFVGEAPGADEDQQGEPFVGRAGQLLTRIIETMGLGRDRVYIGNILKCRPDTPGQRSGNRKPTAAEMQTCLPFLLEQIDIIQPRVLVALGATAVEGLFGRAPGSSFAGSQPCRRIIRPTCYATNPRQKNGRFGRICCWCWNVWGCRSVTNNAVISRIRHENSTAPCLPLCLGDRLW